ncbi:conjugal transfer protein [Salinicoccus halitifaciens]|uniref:Conjugal transfer protein n=1 Tax=Salinicoccus halitifaciens TaxID=1073415 RepID=A0ABV2E8L0_9STAP|nr:conjugal transfer protein [Salinicoccus halitifaciens]MCD2137788.1 conjugal transfer protein [Salinicoccus halitifaciens]
MKLPFRQKEKTRQPTEEKRMKVKTVGTRKKSVLILWVLLISSLAFGIYKNFTAVDQHTVHEKEVIETEMIDTNAIESFTHNFVAVYHSWENETAALEARTVELSEYMTDDLQALNADVLGEDTLTSADVIDVSIWSVAEETENTYAVIYSVHQEITEDDDDISTRSTYRIVLHQDETGNLVITQNPTPWNDIQKSDYEPETVENNNSVDSETEEEIIAFLETFFTAYPTATEQELSYYVKDDVLPPINENYSFSELIDPVFQAHDGQIKTWVTVKYLDETTKANLFSQYELILEKDMNWMIVE